jgi:hypothetical protein
MGMGAAAAKASAVVDLEAEARSALRAAIDKRAAAASALKEFSGEDQDCHIRSLPRFAGTPARLSGGVFVFSGLLHRRTDSRRPQETLFGDSRQRGRRPCAPMIRIAITPAAFDAIAATLPLVGLSLSH